MRGLNLSKYEKDRARARAAAGEKVWVALCQKVRGVHDVRGFHRRLPRRTRGPHRSVCLTLVTFIGVSYTGHFHWTWAPATASRPASVPALPARLLLPQPRLCVPMLGRGVCAIMLSRGLFLEFLASRGGGALALQPLVAKNCVFSCGSLVRARRL